MNSGRVCAGLIGGTCAGLVLGLALVGALHALPVLLTSLGGGLTLAVCLAADSSAICRSGGAHEC